jgi:hypothetical protein
MRSEKKFIAAISLIACLIAALSACNRAESHSAQHQPQSTPAATALTRRVPAYYTEAPTLASLNPTLSPDQFSGKVKKAYQVAKEIPQTLAQLPCFCYCDTIGHKSLHSCYEDDHATGCTVCVDSALSASELKQQGISDGEIRDRLIAKYGGTPGH